MKRKSFVAVVLVGVISSVACADVFDMGGTRNADGTWTGLASLETVQVGAPGNSGELSGGMINGYPVPYRVCGAVGYEYRIGKYEVTAGQYCEFLNAVAKTDTYHLYNTSMWASDLGCKILRDGSPGSYAYTVATEYANRPVTLVTWASAARFVNWLHNGQPTGAQDLTTTEDGAYSLNGADSPAELANVTRSTGWRWAIPTEDEWYKAAYYDPNTQSYFCYPTSSNTIPGRDMNDYSGNNANYYGNPFPIDSDYYHTVVGEFQNSCSPWGTFDQGGNVREWNESIQDDYYRGVRGGSLYDDAINMSAPDRSMFLGTGIPYSLVGFRVVEVPEPGTLSLLALGGLALLGRRRK